jgi:plastocyanin domain-containing protein
MAFFRAACTCFAIVIAGIVTDAQEAQKPKKIEIEITEKGFSPSAIEVAASVPLELVFTRRTDKTCATEVVLPAQKIKKALPLNQPVSVALTPEKDDVTFACGMNMLKGKLVIKGPREESDSARAAARAILRQAQ